MIWGDILLANTVSTPGLDSIEDGRGALARLGRWLGVVEGWRRYHSSKPGPTIRDLVPSTESNDNLDSEMRNESLSIVHG